MFDVELVDLLAELTSFIGEFQVFIVAALILTMAIFAVRRLIASGR